MFWIWFDWQAWTLPLSLEADGNHLKLNETTRLFFKAQPEDAQATAMILEILDEERWEKKSKEWRAKSSNIEIFVRNHPIFRWIIAPLIIAAVVSFADYGCAAGRLENMEPINLDAETMFNATAGRVQRPDKTFIKFGERENGADCHDAFGSLAPNLCHFNGSMDVFKIGGFEMKDVAVFFGYVESTNKVMLYRINKRLHPKTAAKQYVLLVKALTELYGKPTSSSDSIERFFVWDVSGGIAVGAPVEISSFITKWEYKNIEVSASLDFDSVTLVKVNSF